MMVISIIIGYFFFMNLLGLALMGIDKRRAKKRMWRIPELTLFAPALLGGSIGSIIGMYVFHHKTRHWYFRYGIPTILLLQIGIGVAFFVYAPFQFYIM